MIDNELQSVACICKCVTPVASVRLSVCKECFMGGDCKYLCLCPFFNARLLNVYSEGGHHSDAS